LPLWRATILNNRWAAVIPGGKVSTPYIDFMPHTWRMAE
jgi:hypothetical protein